MTDMRRLIKAALFTPTAKGWGLPLLFWGEPGTVKSDLISSVCEDFDMFCLILSPGERGEGAFGVTPVPKMIGDKMYIGYPSPEWVLQIEESDARACIFCDEINTAQGGVKPALLGLIQARRMAGEYLGPGVRVLGAANPPEDAADGGDLPAATANRLGHIEWEAPSLSSWSSWLMGCNALDNPVQKKHSAAKEEDRVLTVWTEAFSIARSKVTAFLEFKTSLLHQKPSAADPNLYKAWPSRRTWYFAALSIASAQAHHLDQDDRNTLIGGFIGEAARREFIKWESETTLPNPLQVLDGKVRFEHRAERLDITRAVLNSCAMAVSDPKLADRDKRAKKMWSLLEYIVVGEGVEDIGIGPSRILHKAPPLAGGKRLSDMEESKKTIRALKGTLESAGYGL